MKKKINHKKVLSNEFVLAPFTTDKRFIVGELIKVNWDDVKIPTDGIGRSIRFKEYYPLKLALVISDTDFKFRIIELRSGKFIAVGNGTVALKENFVRTIKHYSLSTIDMHVSKSLGGKEPMNDINNIQLL